MIPTSGAPAAVPAASTRRLLVIDDDVELCGLVAQFLHREGFAADFVHDGVAGLAAALENRHEAIILDVMLPGLGGFDVLRRLREKLRTPVLMLTARGDHVDRVVGLEIGADDYVPKPFDPRELVARIRAVLRRSETASASPADAPVAGPERLAYEGLVADLGTREASRDGRPLALTPVEFDMLVALMRSAGQLLTRDQLSRLALGRPADPGERAVDVHIVNLRRKVGTDASGARLIRTVRGAGYVLPRRGAAAPR